MSLDEETFEVGNTVCIRGRGTDNVIHRHARITRETKTLWVVEYQVKRTKISRRYRKGYTGREVGAAEYGGTSMSRFCRA